MAEGTAASQWAHAPPTSAPPVRQASKDSTTSSNPRGARGAAKRRSRGGRKQSNANATGPSPATDAPTTSPVQTTAPAPTSETAKSPDPPRMKLIDRLSMAPETPPAPTASVKSDTPAQTESKGARQRRDRANSRRKTPASKPNQAPSVSHQPAEKEPELAGSHTAKDAPPHADHGLSPAPNDTNDLTDKFKTLNLPSAPTTPRPYTPSAIDWAGETEDGSLPDLDDWGVHPVKPASPENPATSKEEGDKVNGLASEDKPGNPGTGGSSTGSAPLHTDNKPSRNKRRDSKAREPTKNNLTVPNRDGTNGNSSSRPATPSSAGLASPSLRGRRRQESARAPSRASTVNDPPHITVTPNPNAPSAENPADNQKPSPTSATGLGLGLDLSETEP
ncbi:hypothetical protein FRC08_017871, partial [Ceratobasidium sp. 394]